MQILDILVAVPILYFGYKGAVNGLVKEILNIVGIILAVFITFKYMDVFSGIIAPLFEENATTIPFVSGAVLFVGTLIVVGIVSVLTKKFLEAVKLGVPNRIFGAFFGSLKAGMMVSTLLLLMSGFNMPAEQSRDDSIFYPYVIHLGPWAYETIAFIYPGAEGFSATVQKNISNYNPVDNLPIINDN